MKNTCRVVFGRAGNTPPAGNSRYGAEAIPAVLLVALSNAVCNPDTFAIANDASGTTGADVNVLMPSTVSLPVVCTAPVDEALSIAACRPDTFAMGDEPSGTSGALMNVLTPLMVSLIVL